MKKTVALTLRMTLAALLTTASGWAQAEQTAGVGVQSLRGKDVAAEDTAAETKAYQGKRPGLQKPIARTFTGQPPLIPHAVENFDEITLEENQCMTCHGPEKFKEKKAPKVGVSHFNNPRTAEVGKQVSTARHNCTSCHVPQVDAKPLVDNAFQGVIGKTGK